MCQVCHKDTACYMHNLIEQVVNLTYTEFTLPFISQAIIELVLIGSLVF